MKPEQLTTEYKHLIFAQHPTPKHRKTEIWLCTNRADVFMGTIEWHCGWRQYCFQPEDALVFSRSCLTDIAHFIQQLMDARKS